MKTEERHELKKNELSEILVKIEPYWRAIVGGIVVLLTLIVVTGVISNNRKASREAGWTAFFGATADRNAEGLAKLGANEQGSSLAAWAFYSSGQGKLVDASTQVAQDRAQAKQNFQEALAAFQQAYDQAGNYELIKQQALWSMGQAAEGLNELDQAKNHFQKIVEDWPESKIAERAQKRLTKLNDPATKDFYDWYFAQTPPKPPAPSATSGGSTIPFGDPPKEPNFDVPDLGDGLKLPISEGTASDSDETSSLDGSDTPDDSSSETPTDGGATEEPSTADTDASTEPDAGSTTEGSTEDADSTSDAPE